MIQTQSSLRLLTWEWYRLFRQEKIENICGNTINIFTNSATLLKMRSYFSRDGVVLLFGSSFIDDTIVFLKAQFFFNNGLESFYNCRGGAQRIECSSIPLDSKLSVMS